MKKLCIFASANRMRLVGTSVLAILLGITLAIPARAGVVFTDFGTGVCGGNAQCISFNGIGQNGDPLGGATETFEPGNSTIVESLANAFTSPGNFTVTDVMLP